MNIAIVPARSGSKGLKNKNLLQINGKSLIEKAVGLGIKCDLIDQVVVSTDSREYERIAVGAGAISYGLRHSNLSGDFASTVDVVLNLLKNISSPVTNILLLQPTSPIRTENDILSCFELLESDPQNDGVVSIEELIEPHPQKLKSMTRLGYLEPFLKNASSEVPRQQLQTLYKLNGAIYLVRGQRFLKSKSFFSEYTKGYVMQKTVNIDTIDDYKYLSFLLDSGAVRLD